MSTRRRDFLRTASAAAVYSLAADSVPVKAATTGEPIRLGHIGVGIRGTQLLKEFLSYNGANVVAAADLYDGCLAHAKEMTGGKIETGKRYEDVLARKDIDAVVIAVPDHWHRQMTLEALAAGKHVYIEKPLTWSVEQGPEIIAAEKKSGKVLMVGSGTKTSALAQKAKELVASGAVGKPMLLRMNNHRNSREGAWLYPIPPDASPQTIDWQRFIGSSPQRPFNPEIFFRWRCWWDYSGGVATDLFVHMLTTLHEVMHVTAPKSVVSQGGLWYWKDGRTVPDVLESTFEYPQGFIAQLHVNLKNSAPAPQMVIYGDQGTLVWDRDKLIVTPEPEDRDIQVYGTNAWPKAMRDQYFRSKGVDPEKPRAYADRPAAKEEKVGRGQEHTAYFIESIREGKPSRENATEGHAAAGAAHLANMSYRQGRKVFWDFEENRVTLS